MLLYKHSLTYKFYKDNRMVTTNNITSMPCNLTQTVLEPKWLPSFNLTGAIFSSRVFIFTDIDNKSITDHNETADQFNIFFANIGAKLSSGNDRHNEDKSFSDFLNNPTENRFNFSLVNESEDLMSINKLKNKKSSGVDEISNKLLKAIGPELSKPLTIIINQF